MSAIQSIEDKCNELLVEKAPFQLPESWRDWLATYAWVFALIGFVLGIISILFLLPALGFVSVVGGAVAGGRWVLFSWLAAIVLIGYVVLLGVAIPKLKVLQKRGWDLIFYSALFFLAYDVVAWLQYPGVGSFFGLLWNVAWAIVGLYFIFQVRSKFVPAKKEAAHKKSVASSKK